MSGCVRKLLGHPVDSPALLEGLDLTRLSGEALMTKKKLDISWEFRTQLGSLKGEHRRVWRFLLCRWDYAGSFVFVV